MSNPSLVTLQLVAGSTNAVALSQTPLVAGNLTLNGALVTAGVATFDVARRVAIASAGADSARVFTLVGTDRYGNAQSETITNVATPTPVNSVKDYLTVTRVSVDAGTAGAITVGTAGVASSPWVLDNPYVMSWYLSIAVQIISGAANWTVEHTYDDPNKGGTTLVASPQGFIVEATSNTPPTLWSLAALRAQAGNVEAQYANQPIMAHRLTINSGTGLVVMQSIQADYMRG